MNQEEYEIAVQKMHAHFLRERAAFLEDVAFQKARKRAKRKRLAVPRPGEPKSLKKKKRVRGPSYSVPLLKQGCLIGCGPADSRHHLIPVGSDLPQTGERVPLCKRCHDLTHNIWGPGHSYHGPTTRLEFRVKLEELIKGVPFCRLWSVGW